MRVLILGGSGAIGSAIARHCSELGMETHVGVRSRSSRVRLAELQSSSSASSIEQHVLDLEDPATVRSTVADCRPDWVVMAAFPAHSRHQSAEVRRRLLGAMTSGVSSVLEALRENRYRGPLTWIGSALSYGPAGQPRDPSAPPDPQTFRGALKTAEGILAAQLAKQFGVGFTEVRVFSGYGPFQQRERLIPCLLKAGITGGRVSLTERPVFRDWIHYEDIARACIGSAKASERGHHILNACSGQLIDNHEVARRIEQIVGRPLVADEPLDWKDDYGEVEPGLLPDATGGIDWAPQIDLEVGLEQTWQWAQSRAGRSYLLGRAEP